MSLRTQLEAALNRLGRLFARQRPLSPYDRLMEAVVDVGMDIQCYAEVRAGMLAVADLDATQFTVCCGIDGWPYAALRERALAGFDLHDAFSGIASVELTHVYAAAFGLVPPPSLTESLTPPALRAEVIAAADRLGVHVVDRPRC